MITSNMLSLSEIKDRIKKLELNKELEYKTVYLYDKLNDEYLTIDNIRIDSENDLVIDIKRV